VALPLPAKTPPMSRKRPSPRAFLSVLLMVLALTSRLPCGAQTVAEFHRRADVALQNFLLHFWDGSQQYLQDQYPSSGALTAYWTYAQGWDALADGVERTSGLQYAGLLDSFYAGQDQSGWFSPYYDDECWMTLVLTRAYDLTADSKYLDKAQLIYADIMGAWDTTCCGVPKGGVWWDYAHTQKATASNAGAALAGARLFQRTGNAAYLSFAQQVYSFWYANMVNATTGHVWDHISTDGTKIDWQFTYNEGLMIGASLELYLATGTSSYLANAHQIAGYLVSHEVITTAYGPVLYDGNNTGCAGDCHEFKGPAIRYLSRLYALDTSKTQYYSVLRASANAVWNLAQDTNSTLFAVNWAGPSQATVDQGQDNAACMALNRCAALTGPYPGSGLPANQYEAENAASHHIRLEASYGSFTGWGYLAGWNTDGSGVDFTINCATAGPHQLVFRYAAGAGDASRVLKTNGVVRVANQVFTNTGAWANYGTLAVACNLPAGRSTISLAFDSTQHSGNYLNLDNLTVLGDAPEQIRLNASLPGTGAVRLNWNTRFGETYRVQYKAALTNATWSDLSTSLLATGTSLIITDSFGTNRARYYRISQP
jgi:predicted alpha-1,6-mannanase (GH76 family)